MTKLPGIAACGVGLWTCFGILTLFVTARWSVTVLEAGLFIQVAALLTWAAVRNVGLRWHAVLLPVSAMAAWAALQAALGLSAAPWRTEEKGLEYLVTLAALVLVVQAAGDRIWRGRMVNGLLIFGTLLAGVSLVQLASSQGKAFWLFDTGYSDRVVGPFVSPNAFAQFVEILFPLALYQAISWRRKTPVMVLAAGILFASVVAGASRAGTIVLLAEIPAVLWLCRRARLVSGRTAGLFSFAFASVIALCSFVVGWNVLIMRFGQDPLADLRWPVMSSSYHMLRDHFWLGAGYGAWPVVYPQYATFDAGLFINQAHCDWLQVACEGGILGFGLFVWSIAALLKGLLRSVWGVGLLGVLCHAILDFPFQHGPAFTVFLFSAATLAAHSEARLRRRHPRGAHAWEQPLAVPHSVPG